MSEEGGLTGDKPAPVDRLSRLWHRINDHKIAQWSIGYIALAYAIQHAIVLTNDAFEWPHELTRISMLLLALGLPLVVTFSWYHGAKANRHFSHAEMTIISVLLMIGALVFYIFVQPKEQTAARPASAVQAAAVSSAPAATKPASSAIAVLPFVNMSGDPKEDYFSDGMTEELTSALAKIPNLPVVGRTSAFSFKDKNQDLRVIGQALGATYVLEGSVRKAGDRVRITAQLVRAGDDLHVWTDSYDRDLKNIFAVQQDVARAIATALQLPLGLGQGETLVSNRSLDPQSYQDYLRAKEIFRNRNTGLTGGNFVAATDLLELVVGKHPDYAPAWALLAQTYVLVPNNVERGEALYSGSLERLGGVAGKALVKANDAARQAITLNPRGPDGYVGMALVQTFRGQTLDAEQSFKQALSLDPNNADTMHWYSMFLGTVGKVKEAVAMRERVSALEPLVVVYNMSTVRMLIAAGDNIKALAMDLALAPKAATRYLSLAEIYASMGRYKEAAAAALDPNSNTFGDVKAAALILQTAPAPAPDYAAGRKTARFKSLVRKMGLVAYWRAKGWPQFCHPTTGDDFECI